MALSHVFPIILQNILQKILAIKLLITTISQSYIQEVYPKYSRGNTATFTPKRTLFYEIFASQVPYKANVNTQSNTYSVQKKVHMRPFVYIKPHWMPVYRHLKEKRRAILPEASYILQLHFKKELQNSFFAKHLQITASVLPVDKTTSFFHLKYELVNERSIINF